MSATITNLARPESAPSQLSSCPPVRPQRGWLVTAMNVIPNLLVFSLLGGVMYGGHHTGWKLPKMSEFMGTAAITSDDWCAEHLVPESQCIECRSELLPKSQSFGFCHEHGVAECVIHHPELAQLKSDPLLPQYDALAAITLMARPENNSRNMMHLKRVQFTSAESVDKAGIEVEVVQEGPVSDVITANGEAMFDPTRVARLSVRSPGTVVLVAKTLGDPVAAGDVLALVDAAQVGQAKTELLRSLAKRQLHQATVERLAAPAGAGAVSQRSLMEAEALLEEARISCLAARQTLSNLGFDVPETPEAVDAAELAKQLQYLGIPQKYVDALPVGSGTANLIPIRAPQEGVVVASAVVAGEVVDLTTPLFTVADPRQLWLVLNVNQEDARYLKKTLPVEFQPDDGSQAKSGEISWISSAVDEQTRKLKVRIPIDNTDSSLRDMTYGTGRIVLRREPNAIIVPRAALQSTSDAHFVFVRDKHYFDESAPKVFHVRQVRLGATEGDHVELLAGVLPGEVVATKGSNVLLAQLLRSSLGAGCACHDH